MKPLPVKQEFTPRGMAQSVVSVGSKKGVEPPKPRSGPKPDKPKR